MQWVKGKVILQQKWTEDLYSLFIKATIHPFQAGQFVQLALTADPVLFRPYSLVNAPSDSALEFYYSLLPHGRLTPALCELKTDDTVYLMPKAAGKLTLSQVGKANILWLFATGTGLGPFLSILKTAEPWEKFSHIVLVHSVGYLSELTHQTLIQSWQEKYSKQFHWLPIVTRQSVANTFSERIPLLLANSMLEKAMQLVLSADTAQVMLCGNPNMVKEVTTLLQSRQFKVNHPQMPGQIHLENYWKA